MIRNFLKNFLFSLNRALDAALLQDVPAEREGGRVHIVAMGIGDILVMLPYYKRFFDAFPPERLLCTLPFTVPLLKALFPGIPVTPFSWFRFRYDPLYRWGFIRGRRYAEVTAEFPSDKDTLATFSLFRAKKLTVFALRGPLPPAPGIREIPNPNPPMSHITLGAREYFSALWKEHSAEAFEPDDSPEAYRGLVRALAAPPAAQPAAPGERYICVSNSTTARYRRYPREKWQRILDGLPPGLKVLHLGSEPLGASREGFIDLAGKTSLQEAVHLSLHSALFIGTETGLLHAAYLGGVKTVCLLGGGHFGHYLPWEKFKDNLRCAYQPMECAPCDWKCRFVNLLNDEVPPCVSGASPERALELAKELGF